jgi:hypothetical protein
MSARAELGTRRYRTRDETHSGAQCGIERFIASYGEACFQPPCGWRADQYLIVHPCTQPGYQDQ